MRLDGRRRPGQDAAEAKAEASQTNELHSALLQCKERIQDVKSTIWAEKFGLPDKKHRPWHIKNRLDEAVRILENVTGLVEAMLKELDDVLGDVASEKPAAVSAKSDIDNSFKEHELTLSRIIPVLKSIEYQLNQKTFQIDKVHEDCTALQAVIDEVGKLETAAYNARETLKTFF